MALTSCRECSGRVAKTAKVCPHCGAPDPNPMAGISAFLWGVVKIAVLFFIVYWIVF